MEGKLELGENESRLSLDEYNNYKRSLQEACAKNSFLGLPFPSIEYDEDKRHIILHTLDGCLNVAEKRIEIPVGITRVCLSDEDIQIRYVKECYNFDMILSDTVQFIDDITSFYIFTLDTNKAECIYIPFSMLHRCKATIKMLIIKDDLNLESLDYNLRDGFNYLCDSVFIMKSINYSLPTDFLRRCNSWLDIYVDYHCQNYDAQSNIILCKDINKSYLDCTRL